MVEKYASHILPQYLLSYSFKEAFAEFTPAFDERVIAKRADLASKSKVWLADLKLQYFNVFQVQQKPSISLKNH